jgi:hypothetical protein
MPRLAALIATALLLLAGCTSSDSGGTSGDGDESGTGSGASSDKPSASATTKAPTGPDCADVWKAGATLPEDYSTCVADGAYGVQDVTKCQDGTRLVAFADSYYAVTGGRIRKPDVAPMQDTEEYGQAFAACTGE